MVNVLQPHGINKKFLDPACGSGGMFVQAARYMHRHNANAEKDTAMNFRCYGVEKEPDTVKLAKMNLLLNNVRGEITEANSFYSDPYNAVGQFDYVMANPPFNVDEIDADKIKNDPRLPFGLPSVNDKGKVKYVCACDGTGAHFVALEFGETVTAEAQWKPSFLPPPTEAGENAIIAAVSADDRVRAWLDSIATTAAGHASITNFSGEAASVQAAYLVGLDTLADPQADLFFENIAVGADGRVTLDGDLKVQGARWRQKVNGTLRLYSYPELGSTPSVTNLYLEGGTFPLVGAEDTSGTNRFFKLVIE
jgi:hypothetical protein